MTDQEAVWKWRLGYRIAALEAALQALIDDGGGDSRRKAVYALHDQSWLYRDPNWSTAPEVQEASRA